MLRNASGVTSTTAATTAGKQGLQRQRSVGAAVSTIEWTPTTIMHDAAEPRIGEVIRLSQRQRRRQAAVAVMTAGAEISAALATAGAAAATTATAATETTAAA